MFSGGYGSASAGATWRCVTCSSSNNASSSKCTACGRPAPETQQQFGGGGDRTPGYGAPSRGHSVTPPPATGGRSASVNGSSVPSAPRPAAASFADSSLGGAPAAATPFSNVRLGSATPPPFVDRADGARTPPPGPVVGSSNVAGGGGVFTGMTPPSAVRNTPPPAGGGGGGAPLNPFSPVPQTPYQQQQAQQQQQQQQQAGVTPASVDPMSALRATPMPDSRAASEAATGNRGGPRTGGQARSPSAAAPPTPAAGGGRGGGGGGMHPVERRMLEEEVTFLRNAVTESKKYGVEIEHTVEYLTDLLRRKTLECEALRTLATENYHPVREAILEQHRAQAKNEKSAQNELKFFQGRIESLYAERTTLLTEARLLREAVDRLERELVVARQPASKPTDNSFFNRVMYGDEREKPPHHMFRVGVANGAVPLMTKLTAMEPRQTAMLRNTGAVNIAMKMLEPDVALRLHSFGFFSYMQYLLTVLLLQQQCNPDTFANAVSESFKVYTAWRASPPPPVSHIKNQHYADKFRQLYEIFMPDQPTERDVLLDLHNGNEYNFWETFVQPLSEHFEEREALARAQRDQMQSAAAAAAGASPKFRGDPSSPLFRTRDAAEVAALGDEENNPPPPPLVPGMEPGSPGSPVRRSKKNTAPVGGSGFDANASFASVFSGSAASLFGGGGAGSAGSGGFVDEEAEIHTRIILMLKKYNPEKLAGKDLQRTLSKYPASVVLEATKAKYGPEPVGEERARLLEEIALMD